MEKPASEQGSATPGSDAEQPTAEAIAAWLESLAGHFFCPPERCAWYRGVALDIRHGGPWKEHRRFVAEASRRG